MVSKQMIGWIPSQLYRQSEQKYSSRMYVLAGAKFTSVSTSHGPETTWL